MLQSVRPLIAVYKLLARSRPMPTPCLHRPELFPVSTPTCRKPLYSARPVLLSIFLAFKHCPLFFFFLFPVYLVIPRVDINSRSSSVLAWGQATQIPGLRGRTTPPFYFVGSKHQGIKRFTIPARLGHTHTWTQHIGGQGHPPLHENLLETKQKLTHKTKH